MKGVFLRVIRQMANDKRSLALIFIAPLMILTLLFLLLGDSPYVPKLGVSSSMPSQAVTRLEEQAVTVTVLAADADVEALLKNGDIDAYLSMSPGSANIRMLEPDSVKMGKITTAVKNALETSPGQQGLNFSYIYGEVTSTFDSLGYVLLGVMAFFVVFILSGVSFIRERTTGTMERLMLTPVRRLSVAAGYTAGFGVFAAVQSAVLVLYAQSVLGLHFSGSVLLAVLIMVLLAFTAVATGTFISIFANNEFQVVQFIPVIIIPQIFFSGMIPIDTLPYHLGLLSYIMPVYYGCTALKAVLLKGEGVAAVWPYLLVLVGLLLLLSLINTLALKKYRSI
ncbi:ABC transporter permease [Oscillospiraceae bacterium WX1]